MSNQGPLSITLDTSAAKTAIPLIADGKFCDFQLKQVTQKDGEKGATISFEFDLVNPTTDTDGNPILPGGLGSKQFVNIQCYAKEDAKDSKWFVKKLARYIDALLGTGDPGNAKGKPARPDFNSELVPQLIGKTLKAKVKVRTGEYTGNDFADVFFPPDLTA